MVRITPQASRTRTDYFESGRAVANTGRLTYALKQVDFSRKPILKITVPDLNGSGTIIGLRNEKGDWKKCADAGLGTTSIDMATMTKWVGTQDVTLTLDPVTQYGNLVRGQKHQGVLSLGLV